MCIYFLQFPINKEFVLSFYFIENKGPVFRFKKHKSLTQFRSNGLNRQRATNRERPRFASSQRFELRLACSAFRQHSHKAWWERSKANKIAARHLSFTWWKIKMYLITVILSHSDFNTDDFEQECEKSLLMIMREDKRVALSTRETILSKKIVLLVASCNSERTDFEESEENWGSEEFYKPLSWNKPWFKVNLALFYHDHSRYDFDLNLGKVPLEFEMRLEISEKYSAYGYILWWAPICLKIKKKLDSKIWNSKFSKFIYYWFNFFIFWYFEF